MSVFTNTVIDNRSNTREQPVWEATIAQISWANGETDTHTSTVAVVGVITQIVAVYSAAAANLTLVIQDAGTNQLYTTGAIADGQTVIKKADGTDFGQNQLTMRNFIVSITSTDPGAGGVTADIVIRGI